MSQEIVLFPPTADMPTPANLRCGRSADEPTVSAQPEHVAVREMPSLFRLVSIKYSPVAPRRFRCGATLFADGRDVRVAWECAQPDTRLNPGVLVSVRWLPRTHSIAGEICIGRLVLLEIPESGADLFKTVPQTWVSDGALLARAAALVGQLSPPLRHLFNAMFWQGRRFHRFLCGPASVAGHHSDMGGNFRHAVEVAELCDRLAETGERIAIDVLLLAALLHDAGKADEYDFDRRRQVFVMSERGALVGHRHTVIEWVAAALATRRILLPEIKHLGLLHCLTAGVGADFLGIRRPATLEAKILSLADRLSGDSDLFRQNAREQPGFGRYHKHLQGRPFLMEGTRVD